MFSPDLALIKYPLSLLLTLIVEGGVAWLFGFRAVRSLLAVAIISCITNPALNVFLLVLAWRGVAVTLLMVTLLEIVVVVVEWQLLVYVFGNPQRRLFYLSLAANAASYLTGVLIFW